MRGLAIVPSRRKGGGDSGQGAVPCPDGVDPPHDLQAGDLRGAGGIANQDPPGAAGDEHGHAPAGKEGLGRPLHYFAMNGSRCAPAEPAEPQGFPVVELADGPVVGVAPAPAVHQERDPRPADERSKGSAKLRGMDPAGKLLIDDDEIQPAQGAAQPANEVVRLFHVERVRSSHVDAPLLGLPFHGLDVHGGGPVMVLAQKTLGPDPDGLEQPGHLPSKGVISDHAKRRHGAHAHCGAVVRDVARPSQGVALPAHGCGGQTRLNGYLGQGRVEVPVGVEAEIPDYADPRRADV